MEQKIITFSKGNQVKVGRNLTIVGVTDDMLECVLFSSSLSKYVYIDIANLSDSLKNTIINNYLCENKNVPTFDEFFLDVMTEVSKALATTDKPLDIRISTDHFNYNDRDDEIYNEIYEIDVDCLKQIYNDYICNAKVEYVSIDIVKNVYYDNLFPPTNFHVEGAEETDYFVEYKFSSIGEKYQIRRKGQGFHSVK